MNTEPLAAIILNGEQIPDSQARLEISNRAFRYGDAFFESIRLINGRPVFLDRHMSRIKRTMQFLDFDQNDVLSPQALRQSINTLAKVNGVDQGGKARLMVWRKRGGLYGPKSNEIEFLIECEAQFHNQFTLNKNGLKLGIFDHIQINPAPISHHKTTNSLPYIMAAKWKAEKGFDDVLMLDCNGYLAEASSSNLFVLINGSLITPDLEYGGLMGTMRDTIIDLISNSNLALDCAKLRPEDLNQADEVFLTNASSGVRWVGAYGKKRYFKRVAEQLVSELNRIALFS